MRGIAMAWRKPGYRAQRTMSEALVAAPVGKRERVKACAAVIRKIAPL